jgi:hypothetical protein
LDGRARSVTVALDDGTGELVDLCRTLRRGRARTGRAIATGPYRRGGSGACGGWRRSSEAIASGVSGDLGEARLAMAVDDLLDLPIERQPMTGLMRRAHELRSNVTPYDAVYVALAEALDCVLVTADRRLASTPGMRADAQVVQ